MLKNSIDAFVNKSLDLAHEVIAFDDVVDDLFDVVKDDLISLINKDIKYGNRLLTLS